MYVISTDDHHIGNRPQRWIKSYTKSGGRKYTTDISKAKRWATENGAAKWFAQRGLRNHFIHSAK